MHIGSIYALVLIAACALPTPASAQKVYKCGNSYSQIPCQGGETLEPTDTRTAAQKTDALRVQKMQSHEADTLEKARLKDEDQTGAVDAANSKSAEKQAKTVKTEELARAKEKAKKPADGPTVLSAPGAKKHKKAKEPEFFTARKAADAKN